MRASSSPQDSAEKPLIEISDEELTALEYQADIDLSVFH